MSKEKKEEIYAPPIEPSDDDFREQEESNQKWNKILNYLFKQNLNG